LIQAIGRRPSDSESCKSIEFGLLPDSAERSATITTHARGLVITLAGVLILSPASLLVRLGGADPWTVILYQSGLMAVPLIAFYIARPGRTNFAIGKYGILAAAFFGIDNILFVAAVSNTNVTNALVILAAAPLFASIGSRVFLRETVALRTWVSVVVGMAGVVVIFSGSVSAGRMAGNLAALGAAAAIAGALVSLRRAPPHVMVPSVSLGAVGAAVIAVPFAAPLSVGGDELAYLMLLGVVVLPVSFYLIFHGPRFISAPEVSLLMLSETFLGPLWVWLALEETPASEALAGGTVVIGAIAVHSLLALRAANRKHRAPI
jgi:drug/metabolite transporter (DMT)-like permease